jgi:hypothetical protein
LVDKWIEMRLRIEALGFVVTDEDREVIGMMEIEAIIESRYIRTGAKRDP